LIGISKTVQTGALRTNMNSVNASGARKNEVLPNERDRNALTLRQVRALTENLAAHLDYRYYFDGWGINAHTVEPSLAIAFADDDGLLRFSYRFHTQTKTVYYEDSFPVDRNFMTSDSDLSAMSTQELATQASYTIDSPTTILDTLLFGAGAAYYKRSNDLKIIALQTSLGATF
jgi:hypothetical protein